MSELDKLRELRWYISRAREACAGSNVQSLSTLYVLVREAYVYSKGFNFNNIKDKLFEIWDKIELIKDYGDRLPLDNELCDILNNLDMKIRELECK